MRRILLVLSVAALMASMVLGGAGSALAKENCKEEGDFFVVERCAGGSGGPGGGGGGKTDTESIGTFTLLERTTGGGSNFRGSDRGGGGTCTVLFENDFGCQTGSTAEHP